MSPGQSGGAFFGAVWVAQAVLPHVRAQGGGRLLQVTSVGSGGGMATVGFYGADKAALDSVSEALAMEVEGFGIKVTIVQMGGYDTGLFTTGTTTAEPLAQYQPLRTGPKRICTGPGSTSAVSPRADPVPHHGIPVPVPATQSRGRACAWRKNPCTSAATVVSSSPASITVVTSLPRPAPSVEQPDRGRLRPHPPNDELDLPRNHLDQTHPLRIRTPTRPAIAIYDAVLATLEYASSPASTAPFGAPEPLV